MNKVLFMFFLVFLLVATVSCEEKSTEEKKPKENDRFPVAFIVKGKDRKNFNDEVWEEIKTGSSKYGLNCKRYKSEKNGSYNDTIRKAASAGGEIIIFSGKENEITVFDMQKKHDNLKFLLVDGVPHSQKYDYSVGENTVGAVFAEEEAGFLAGYAAVKNGWHKIGFIGENEEPPIKRYGHGFIQGVNTAAEEIYENKKGKIIEIKYDYMSKKSRSKEVENVAGRWFKKDTEIIFAGGGRITPAIIRAAEKREGKIIGSDMDQRNLSHTVVMSAEKNIASVIEDALVSYKDGNYSGGITLNYTAKTDGIKLSFDDSEVKNFKKEDYKAVFSKLKKGAITIKKDEKVKSLKSLAGTKVNLIDHSKAHRKN